MLPPLAINGSAFWMVKNVPLKLTDTCWSNCASGNQLKWHRSATAALANNIQPAKTLPDFAHQGVDLRQIAGITLRHTAPSPEFCNRFIEAARIAAGDHHRRVV